MTDRLLSQVLNPDLYSRLREAFGRVKVMNKGLAGSYGYRRPALGMKKGQRLFLEPRRGDSGESYMICCPFCLDTKFRCSVSYRYDTEDDYGHRSLHLLKCFNEDCFQTETYRRQLFYEMLIPSPRAAKIRKVRQTEYKPPAITSPGQVKLLSSLAPDHPAVQYVAGERKFDVDEVSRIWRACYCLTSKYKLATNRLIIPYFRDTKLVGWQARSLDPNLPKGVPKYWTCPGMARSESLYNIDQATDVFARWGLVVVCEGPLDVWRVGAPAVALMGKSASLPQLDTLSDRFGSGLVVSLLDPAQDEKAAKRGDPHHIELFNEALRGVGFTRKSIVDVYLDGWKDAGEADYWELWSQIARAAKAQGKTIPTGVLAYVRKRCRRLAG